MITAEQRKPADLVNSAADRHVSPMKTDHSHTRKEYVLVLLFIKYVSDKYAGVPYAPITISPGNSGASMTSFTTSASSTLRSQPQRPPVVWASRGGSPSNWIRV